MSSRGDGDDADGVCVVVEVDRWLDVVHVKP